MKCSGQWTSAPAEEDSTASKSGRQSTGENCILLYQLSSLFSWSNWAQHKFQIVNRNIRKLTLQPVKTILCSQIFVFENIEAAEAQCSGVCVTRILAAQCRKLQYVIKMMVGL